MFANRNYGRKRSLYITRPPNAASSVLSTVYRTLPTTQGPNTTVFTVDQLIAGIGVEPTSARSASFLRFTLEIEPTNTVGAGANYAPSIVQPFIFSPVGAAIPFTAGKILNLTKTTVMVIQVPIQLQRYFLTSDAQNVLAIQFEDNTGLASGNPPIAIRVTSSIWLTSSTIPLV